MVTLKFRGFGSDKEVTAKTGDILLRVAKDNGITINHNCEEGNCGSCVVSVEIMDKNTPTERLDSEGKELSSLVEMGVYTKQDASTFEMNDITPRVRLACQTIVRGNSIIKPYNI